jgi:thiamine-phosphate pyrophosphorylase
MDVDLYVVTDERLSHGLSHGDIARQAVLGGADVIQLREKARPGREIFTAAREIRAITRENGALFIVNDRLDIALASAADGIHLGQDDLPLTSARRLAPEGFIIGVSVGSVDEALRAEADGADYVALSPVFPTSSKPDAGPGSGLEVLRRIRSAVPIPIVAIGGIGPQNVRDVVHAGADGVAVISAVVGQEDIISAAMEMKSLITAAKREKARR